MYTSYLLPGLARLFEWMQTQDLRVGTLFLHEEDLEDLQKDFNSYDRTSRREVLALGIRGALWGATVRTSPHVLRGHVVILPEGIDATVTGPEACIRIPGVEQ